MLHYYKLGSENRLVDPTPDKIWLKKKAQSMGLTLFESPALPALLSVHTAFHCDMANLDNSDGWPKSLNGIPRFTADKIEKHFERVNAAVTSKSSIVKKHFSRGAQLLEEQYVDLNSIFSKQNDSVFCVKGVVAASLKKQTRWVFIAIDKSTADINYGYCGCAAGKAGTCSHTFVIMKLVAKWVVDRIKLRQV